MEKLEQLEHWCRKDALSKVREIYAHMKRFMNLECVIDPFMKMIGTFAAFRKELLVIDPEFVDFFVTIFFLTDGAYQQYVQLHNRNAFSNRQDKPALLRSETTYEDVFNDIIEALIAPFNKKHSANAEESSDKINKKNGEKENKRGRKSRSRSRDRKQPRFRSQDPKERGSQMHHRSRDRGHVSEEINCQEKLKKDEAMGTPLSSRVMIDEKGYNGLILCGKYLPDEI